jgi:hypothetical protein
MRTKNETTKFLRKKFVSLSTKTIAMTAIQLNAQKMDIIEMLVGINNEKAIAKISSLVRKSTDDNFERVPGLAYTREERIASVRKAVDDYNATGISYTSEEMRARHPRV